MAYDCKNNVFCSLLSPEEQTILCQQCLPMTWQKGQEISIETLKKYAILIQSGLLTCTTSPVRSEPKTVTLYVSGDFLAYFAFSPDAIGPFYPGTITCIKKASALLFPMESIRELFMKNPQVAQYMLIAANSQQLRTQTYLHFVLQQDSYDALSYLLDFCKQNQVPRLTYDELGKISNLHRVTVTRTMKDILKSSDFRA